MTYCVGLMLDVGLVFMSDSRTNAGLDNVSTFCKIFNWEERGEKSITLLAAGNLATTQSVIGYLDERLKVSAERKPKILEAESMFQAATIVGETLKQVIAKQTDQGQRADSAFNANFIIGGQIKGSPPRLFLIYPEGNFIEASVDAPFFQIGEIKYGRPILVRGFDYQMDFGEAIRLLLVSFDSTMKANLTVAPPLDYHCYKKNSLELGVCSRIEAKDDYFLAISNTWGDALRSALLALPTFKIDRD